MKTLFLMFTLSFIVSSVYAGEHPQYGFAHRVNDIDEISEALAAGANGIEIDICYGGGGLTFRSEDWYVGHNDTGIYCAASSVEHLHEWLEKLASLLDENESYRDQLAMLWIDIKDPGDGHLREAVDKLHAAGLPDNVEVIYDLTAYNTFGRAGFSNISDHLNDNEGISFCAGKSCGGSLATVGEIYQFYKSEDFKRGGFNHGDSINTDEEFLTEANRIQFNVPTDPYRFKHVFTWTNSLPDSMEDHINPEHSHQTDGQIVGRIEGPWIGSDKEYISRFINAVEAYSSTERLAVPADNIFYTPVEVFDNKNYTVRNRWTSSGCIIHIDFGGIDCTKESPGWVSAQWAFESISGSKNYKIRNKWRSNQYIHIEDESVESGPLSDSDLPSAQWELEVVDEGMGYVRIRNVSAGCYIHVENGGIECGSLGDPEWKSAQWALSDPSSTFADESHIPASLEKARLLLPSGETAECLSVSDGGIIARNRVAEVHWQGDGNLILYNRETAATMWMSDTETQGDELCFQEDGNLVIYDINGDAVWATGTDPSATVFHLEYDCNLRAYDETNTLDTRLPWSTRVSCDSIVVDQPENASGIAAEFRINDEWGAGYCVDLVISNNNAQPTSGWSVILDTHGTEIFTSWNFTRSGSSGQVMVKNIASWDAEIAPGETFYNHGFCAFRVNGGLVLPSVISAGATFQIE